tara:strand:+ start:29 stop:295 length:267 start_codon:yes stop_codon:yes gene_type:complete
MVDNLGIRKIKKENKSKKINKGERMEKCFSLEEIKLAVDIAIGDDGFRGREVCDILDVFWKEREEEAERKIQDQQAQDYKEKIASGFL